MRVTFKTEIDEDVTQATMESANQSNEAEYFIDYEEVTRFKADLFNHTTGGEYAIRLNGSEGEVFGLARSLQVQPGDIIDVSVFAKYFDPAESGSWAPLLSTLISQVATNPSGIVFEGGGTGTTGGSPFGNLLTGANGNDEAPKAFLNWLIFDQNFQPVSNGYQQISTASKEDGTEVPHEELTQTLNIEKAGYVYIYLSNEEGANSYDVFFDDFTVTHTHTPIVQKDDYYPFGLTFNSYTSGTENLYKYNGKEDQKETGLYDYGLRFYDPAIAKFTAIDPLSEGYYEWSPYNYVGGNPIKRTDTDGAFWTNVVGGLVGAAVEYGTQVAVNYATGKSGSDAWTDVDVADIVVSGVEGAITSGASVAKNLVKKAAIIGVSEVVKAAVDGTAKEGITVETDVAKVATDAAIGTAFAVGGSEAGKALVGASSEAAVKSAKSGVTAANKNLNKAVNAVQNGDLRSNATLPKLATDNLTSAKSTLSTTKALNSTVGANKVTQEASKATVDYGSSVSGTGATAAKDELLK